MRLRRVTLALSLLLAGGGALTVPLAAEAATPTAYAAIVPAPVSATATAGVSFAVRPGTVISTDSLPVGEYLAAFLRRSTGYPLPVRPATGPAGGIALLLSGAPASVGDE